MNKKEIHKLIIPRHSVKSRLVTEKDLSRVVEDGLKMYELLKQRIGVFSGGLAVAHPQITDDDPLCFFVTKEGDCVINPKIINHTKVTCRKEEGCLTYHTQEYGIKIVDRWHKCIVEYQALDEDGNLLDKVKESCSGKRAQIFQHELDHFDSIYIWPQE